jgi:hypothetical protein
MATAHLEMHSEHRQWLSDNALWRDEAVLWQNEIDNALKEMKKLEDALRDHRKELNNHLATISAEEKIVAEHECALADFEKGGPGDSLVSMARTHKQTADNHSQQRQAHERLKKHHHTVIAYWSLLLKSLTQKK